MTKTKGLLYFSIMVITLIGELTFISLALQGSDYMFYVGAAIFYLIQAALGGVIFAEGVFKHNSESHWVTMGTFTFIPFGTIVSSYFLYRVCKGE